MIAVDGREVRAPLDLTCHTAVVGSGPAGAAVARLLARAGVDVLVVEEGLPPGAPRPDAFGAMAALYRDMGAQVSVGRAPLPLVQGVAVGGTSVINGAISWRLPAHVREEWLADDPGLEPALADLDRVHDQVESDLGIAPTDPAVAGENDRLLARGAEALGLAHRPTSRNVRGCAGTGRCLLACPTGAKQSMDRTYLADAVASAARIAAGIRVERIEVERGRIRGMRGTARGGGRVRVRAQRVVLAASAIQTPWLLLASGIRHGPVGRHFACHPGVSMLGRFPHPVHAWTGSTQGHEVIGLVKERIKLEALGLDLGVLGSRIPGAGRAHGEILEQAAHLASWGAAIRATTEGRVVRGWTGPRVHFSVAPPDLARFRRALRVMAEAMFAAGAEWVAPGVAGLPSTLRDRSELALLDAASDDPRRYTAVVTHMFGTARMGTDPSTSVVRPDFRHHTVPGLYVADSSVFPSNTGVNPQTSILALATRCGEGLVR